jgi:hypothetical protein
VRATDFRGILRELCTAEVEFVVVGALGAVLQGAPLTTRDLDIVHSTRRENVERLVRVLDRLHAYYRTRPGQRIPPLADALEGPGHHLFVTDSGALDVLGRIHGGLGYEELAPRAVALDLDGAKILVQDLEGYIAIKEALGSEKDRAQLPVLRRTLEEIRRCDATRRIEG